ncbi:MAG: hypothetical protein ACLP50_10190 [Solirubrobacteraceae bacterium]
MQIRRLDGNQQAPGACAPAKGVVPSGAAGRLLRHERSRPGPPVGVIGFGGRASIGELLLDPPAFVQTANVFDMLLALPKVGRVKATKIMNSCRVSPNKTLGGLSDRQRAELAERLNQ